MQNVGGLYIAPHEVESTAWPTGPPSGGTVTEPPPRGIQELQLRSQKGLLAGLPSGGTGSSAQDIMSAVLQACAELPVKDLAMTDINGTPLAELDASWTTRIPPREYLTVQQQHNSVDIFARADASIDKGLPQFTSYEVTSAVSPTVEVDHLLNTAMVRRCG